MEGRYALRKFIYSLSGVLQSYRQVEIEIEKIMTLNMHMHMHIGIGLIVCTYPRTRDFNLQTR